MELNIVSKELSSLIVFFSPGPKQKDKIDLGPEGLEPSTNCSAGSHSVQAEL